MAPPASTVGFRQLARNTVHDITHITSILREDPELQGPEGNGAWRLSSSPAFSRLEAVLKSLHLSLNDKAADVTDHFGHVEALPQSGETTANLLLTRAPTLCQGVLELTALLLRWPGCDTWLPCEERQGGVIAPVPPAIHLQSERAGSDGPGSTAAPAAGAASKQAAGAAAASRIALKIRLAHVRSYCLSILGKLLDLGPQEQSYGLACTLLRMHTLQACSRSLAHAVERLVAAQAQPGICAELQADTAPTPGAAGLAALARGTSAGGSSSGCGSCVVEGPMEALEEVVTCAILALQALSSLFGRLGGCAEPGESGGAKGGAGGRAAAASSSSTTSAITRDGWSSRDTLVGLLREALPSSAAYEHAARGTLHLMHATRGARPDVMTLFVGLVLMYEKWAEELVRCGLGDVRDAVLGGPCATYLASAAGLQLLCTADGGRSYGMRPPAAQEDLESYWLQGGGEVLGGGAGGSREGAGQGGSGVRRMEVVPLLSLAHAVGLRERKRRSGADIFLRLGQLAVASLAQHEAGGGGGEGVGGGGGSGSSVPVARQRYMMDPYGSAYLATMALRRYRGHLELFSGRARQEADVEGWRLACAVARAVRLGEYGTLLRQVARGLFIDLGPVPAGGCLPAAAPPALAAAVSGGLLPCLERLVRRAGAATEAAAAPGYSLALRPQLDPYATEQQLLHFLLAEYDREPYLVWLLAYGKPEEAAALVTSVGKLLRGVAAGSMLSRAAGSERDKLRANIAEGVLTAACRALADAAGVATSARQIHESTGVIAAAEAPEEGPQGPVQQLLRMAVLAACEWLPPLYEVVVEVARQVMAAGPGRSKVPALHVGAGLLHSATTGFSSCMLWLPLRLGGMGQANAGVEAAAAAASTAQSATTAAQEAAEAAPGELGRRRLRRLAQEVPPVELVGAGMTLMAHVAAGEDLDGADEETLKLNGRMCEQLLWAGYALAAASPGAVRRALACGGAADGGVPAHCAWRSSTVRQLMERLPRDCKTGMRLAGALEAWERAAEEAVGAEGTLAAPSNILAKGGGQLNVMGPELEQPSPLRRCSWWRCTNLAGDSEAGLPLQACARCGAAWYCGRGCQVAHWRAGHKGECGSSGGGGERDKEQA